MSVSPNASNRVTEAEYLAFERDSDLKHEYIDGAIVAMVGASERHNRIVMNTSATIYAHVSETNCDVFPSDRRLKITATNQYTYPDLSGLCGALDLTDDHLDTYTNPLFIIEVLSPNTERYDRGAKFHAYKTIASLQEYVLVSQESPHVEVYRRGEDGQWIYTDAIGLDASITLERIGCTLPLSAVYKKVTFEA